MLINLKKRKDRSGKRFPNYNLELLLMNVRAWIAFFNIPNAILRKGRQFPKQSGSETRSGVMRKFPIKLRLNNLIN